MGMAQLVDGNFEQSTLMTVDTRKAVPDDLTSLRKHPLFESLTPDDFDSIVQQSRRIGLGRQQLVYRQDQRANHFFFVISGGVRLYRLDRSGVERTLDSNAPGDCFAEVMIYAEPASYACFAETLKPTELLIIPVRPYKTLLEQQIKYAQSALRHYAARAVSRFHDLEIMTVQNARGRLIRYLVDLLPQNGLNGGEIKLPLPKCLVASRLAMQPETFSRILAELKTNNLIRVDRSKLYIPDLARLIQVEQ